MPVARVQLPDGRIARIEVPEGTTPQQAMAMASQVVPKPAPTMWQQLAKATGNVVGGAVEGAASIPDAVTEAIAGGMRNVTNTGGRLGSAVYRGIGMPDAAKRVEGYRSMIDQSLAHPATIGGGVRRVAPVPTDTAGQVARFGAQMLGGAAVPMGPKVTPPTRFPKPVAPRKVAPRELMAAADRHNVTLLPADVGGVGTRMATGAFGRTLGGIPIAEGAKKSIQSLADARTNVAAGFGQIADETGAGQAAQRGARSFIAKSEKRGEDLYDNISIPNDALVRVANAKKVLREINKGLDSNPDLSRIWAENSRMQDTAEALARTTNADGKTPNWAGAGKLSWEDLKRFRTIVGKTAGRPGLTADGSTVEALRKLYAGLSTDMEAAAASTSPRALTEFQRANQYWRGRQDRIGNVLTDILGLDANKGQPAAFNQIANWAKAKGGDPNRLARAMRSMPTEEQATIRATMAGRLGNARPGAQNATGSEFSPSTFVTDWNGMSDRAKSTIFPQPGQLGEMGDLANISAAMKRAGEYQNYSNTSLGNNLAAHAAGFASAPIATGLAVAGEMGVGKALASPKLARMLANAGPEAGLLGTSMADVTAPYLNRMPVGMAANYADEAGGLLGQRFMPSLAAEDERNRKKKKNQR